MRRTIARPGAGVKASRSSALEPSLEIATTDAHVLAFPDGGKLVATDCLVDVGRGESGLRGDFGNREELIVDGRPCPRLSGLRPAQKADPQFSSDPLEPRKRLDDLLRPNIGKPRRISDDPEHVIRGKLYLGHVPLGRAIASATRGASSSSSQHTGTTGSGWR